MNLEKDFDLIYNRILKEEGIRLVPYKDTEGKETIGIGRCIDTNPFTSEEIKAVGDWKHGITKNAAMMLFRNDIQRCEKELRENIPFYQRLNTDRQFVLLNMCFQIGIKGLMRFEKMLYCLNCQDYLGAYYECIDSRVYKQTPHRTMRNARALKTGVWND